MTPTIKIPIVHGKVDDSAKSLEQIQPEKQIVLHCTYIPTTTYGSSIRIWPGNLFLIDPVSGSKSGLVWFHNVTAYPTWKSLQVGIPADFTLVFESLPDNCSSFDMCEIIHETGGFMIYGIQRNESDVYSVSIE